MKTILCAIPFLAVISCNSGPTDNTGLDMKTSAKDSVFNLCYTSFAKKDTVLLKALMYGDSIKGSLGYKLYEKEQQNGLVMGKMHGDTLRALYTFMAGDSEFINEVVFIRKDTLLIEGTGDRVLKKGQFVFKNKNNLRYDGIVLIKDDCK